MIRNENSLRNRYMTTILIRYYYYIMLESIEFDFIITNRQNSVV